MQCSPKKITNKGELTNQELDTILKTLKTLPEENSDTARLILKAAADSVTLEALQKILPSGRAETAAQNANRGNAVRRRGRSSKVGFTFTNKEIKSIPTMYKKIFAYNDKIIPYRYHKGVYEAHFRRSGLNVFACAKDFSEMKRKLIEKLSRSAEQNIQPKTERKQLTQPATAEQANQANNDVLFTFYVRQWLEIKRKTTKPSTFKEYERLCRYNLETAFEGMKIGDMTRAVIQNYLFKIVDEGKHRTAEKLSQLLTCIFDLACEDLNIASPMKKIVLPYYETKKGSALTKEEESKLVNFCIENPENAASSALLVLLYFGLRKSELSSIRVQNEQLECTTSKTRFGRGEVKRKIPFTPVFRRVQGYVDFEKAKATNVHTIATTFKKLFPNRHPHELRYNFITRAKESGVSGEVVMLWAGHTFDSDVKTSAVDRGYTTYGEEYLRKEAEKVNYALL